MIQSKQCSSLTLTLSSIVLSDIIASSRGLFRIVVGCLCRCALLISIHAVVVVIIALCNGTSVLLRLVVARLPCVNLRRLASRVASVVLLLHHGISALSTIALVVCVASRSSLLGVVSGPHLLVALLFDFVCSFLHLLLLLELPSLAVKVPGR